MVLIFSGGNPGRIQLEFLKLCRSSKKPSGSKVAPESKSVRELFNAEALKTAEHNLRAIVVPPESKPVGGLSNAAALQTSEHNLPAIVEPEKQPIEQVFQQFDHSKHLFVETAHVRRAIKEMAKFCRENEKNVCTLASTDRISLQSFLEIPDAMSGNVLRFEEGPLLKVLKYGGTLLLDLTALSPEDVTGLNGLFGENGKIMIGGKEYPLHQDTHIVAIGSKGKIEKFGNDFFSRLVGRTTLDIKKKDNEEKQKKNIDSDPLILDFKMGTSLYDVLSPKLVPNSAGNGFDVHRPIEVKQYSNILCRNFPGNEQEFKEIRRQLKTFLLNVYPDFEKCPISCESKSFESPVKTFVSGKPDHISECLVVNFDTWPVVRRPVVVDENGRICSKPLPEMDVYVTGDLGSSQWFELVQMIGNRKLFIDPKVTIPDFLSSMKCVHSSSEHHHDGSVSLEDHTPPFVFDCAQVGSVSELFVQSTITTPPQQETTLDLEAMVCTLTNGPLSEDSFSRPIKLINVPEHWKTHLEPLMLGAPLFVPGLEAPITRSASVTVEYEAPKSNDFVASSPYDLAPSIPKIDNEPLVRKLAENNIIATESVLRMANWFFDFTTQTDKRFGCIEGCVGRGKDDILDGLCDAYGYEQVKPRHDVSEIERPVCHLTASLHLTKEEIKGLLSWAEDNKVLLIVSEVNAQPLFLECLETSSVRAIFTTNPQYNYSNGQASGYKGRFAIPDSIKSTMMYHEIKDYTPDEYRILAKSLKPEGVDENVVKQLAEKHIAMQQMAMKHRLVLQPSPRDFFNALKQLNTSSFEEVSSRIYSVYEKWGGVDGGSKKTGASALGLDSKLEESKPTSSVKRHNSTRGVSAFLSCLAIMAFGLPLAIGHIIRCSRANIAGAFRLPGHNQISRFSMSSGEARKLQIVDVDPPGIKFFMDGIQRVSVDGQGKFVFEEQPSSHVSKGNDQGEINYTIKNGASMSLISVPVGYEISTQQPIGNDLRVTCVPCAENEFIPVLHDKPQVGSATKEDIEQHWPELATKMDAVRGQAPQVIAAELASFIRTNMTYDLDYNPTNKSSQQWQTILTDKRGVCMHSAVLLTMVLQIMGIESYYITGYQRDDVGDSATGHAKVLVKIGSTYEEFDPTPRTREQGLLRTLDLKIKKPDWLSGKIMFSKSTQDNASQKTLLTIANNPLHGEDNQTLVTRKFNKAIIFSKEMSKYVDDNLTSRCIRSHRLCVLSDSIQIPDSQASYVEYIDTPKKLIELSLYVGNYDRSWYEKFPDVFNDFELAKLFFCQEQDYQKLIKIRDCFNANKEQYDALTVTLIQRLLRNNEGSHAIDEFMTLSEESRSTLIQDLIDKFSFYDEEVIKKFFKKLVGMEWVTKEQLMEGINKKCGSSYELKIQFEVLSSVSNLFTPDEVIDLKIDLVKNYDCVPVFNGVYEFFEEVKLWPDNQKNEIYKALEKKPFESCYRMLDDRLIRALLPLPEVTKKALFKTLPQKGLKFEQKPAPKRDVFEDYLNSGDTMESLYMKLGPEKFQELYLKHLIDQLNQRGVYIYFEYYCNFFFSGMDNFDKFVCNLVEAFPYISEFMKLKFNDVDPQLIEQAALRGIVKGNG